MPSHFPLTSSLQLTELGQSDEAAKVWAEAVKYSKTAYIPRLEYTRALEYVIRLLLIRRLITPARHQRNYEEARKAFTKAAKFQLDLDWPEMLWEAWLAFEHSHGTVEEIQDALDVVERARVQVEARRAKVLNLSCWFSYALLKVAQTGGRADRLSSCASRGRTAGCTCSSR